MPWSLGERSGRYTEAGVRLRESDLLMSESDQCSKLRSFQVEESVSSLRS